MASDANESRSKVSKGWKIALIVGGCSVGGCSLMVGAGVWWAKTHGPELAAEGKRMKAEAEEFAQGKKPSQCEDEALKRHDACEGFTCAVTVNVFLQACLEAVVPDPVYCERIPSESEFMESVQYRVDRCEEVGRPGNLCQQLFGTTQRYCDELESSENGSGPGPQ